MRAASGAASGARHVLGVGLQALLIAAIIAVVALAMSAVYKPAGFVAGVDQARAGRSTADSWIKLASVGGARVASTATPNLGDWVAFDAGWPKTVKNPRIDLKCYQGDALVYGETSAVDESLQLGGGGSIWKERGGDAHCVANLFYFGYHAGKQTYEFLAKDEFDANG